MLVKDKQTNGVQYTLDQFLQTPTFPQNLHSPYNLDNKYRFQVLIDKIYNMGENWKSLISIKWFKKLTGSLRYEGNLGDITDLSSVSYSIVFIGSNAAPDDITISSYNRLRFYDS